jgi:hypothetical protein
MGVFDPTKLSLGCQSTLPNSITMDSFLEFMTGPGISVDKLEDTDAALIGEMLWCNRDSISVDTTTPQYIAYSNAYDNWVTGKISKPIYINGGSGDGDDGGLSGGAIAGIVIAVIVVLAILAFAFYNMYTKYNHPKYRTLVRSSGSGSGKMGKMGPYDYSRL